MLVPSQKPKKMYSTLGTISQNWKPRTRSIPNLFWSVSVRVPRAIKKKSPHADDSRPSLISTTVHSSRVEGGKPYSSIKMGSPALPHLPGISSACRADGDQVREWREKYQTLPVPQHTYIAVKFRQDHGSFSFSIFPPARLKFFTAIFPLLLAG